MVGFIHLIVWIVRWFQQKSTECMMRFYSGCVVKTVDAKSNLSFGTGLNELKHVPNKPRRMPKFQRIRTNPAQGQLELEKNAICNLWLQLFSRYLLCARKLMRHLHVLELVHLMLFTCDPTRQPIPFTEAFPDVIPLIFPSVTSTTLPLTVIVSRHIFRHIAR